MPDLGWTPATGYDVNLVTDNDFIASLASCPPLAAGAVVKLLLGSTVAWPATVMAVTVADLSDDTRAKLGSVDPSTPATQVSWNVDKATVNAAITQLSSTGRVRAAITYTDAAGLDLTWTTGKVRFA